MKAADRYPNIEAERARFGLTKEQMATKLNITRKTYDNWVEKGKIPSDKLCEMADMFSVSMDYLVGRVFKGAAQ